MKLSAGAAMIMMLVLSMMATPSQAGFFGKGITKCQTISKPGRYTLSRNLNQVAVDCLVIAADFVTVDLNGFAIMGDFSGDCITDGGSSRIGTVIINGTVANCFDGIDFNNTDDCKIEEIRAINNNEYGIRVDDGCIIKNNVANDNDNDGINAESDNTIVQNVVNDNDDDGICVNADSTVIGNSANGNFNNDIDCGSDTIAEHNAAGSVVNCN